LTARLSILLAVCSSAPAQAGSLYYATAIDAGTVLRIEDLTGDGDALDPGEALVWAQGLAAPQHIARAGDVFYVSTYDTGEVWRLQDSNGDGDALDAGEQTLFASGIGGPTGLLADADGVFVAARTDEQTRRLVDLTGDGDALDVGENVVHANVAGQPEDLVEAAGGGYFVSLSLVGRVDLVRDLNGDGDALDVGEVAPFAGGVFAGLQAPTGLAPDCGAGVVIADLANDRIVVARDLNGDGDAFDIGETRSYAGGLDGPVGVAASDDDGDGVIDCLETCPWDCAEPADGQVGVVDFLAMLAQWGSENTCDFDGNGVGVTDFLALLAHWGPCP
jgi:hypothetical protein